MPEAGRSITIALPNRHLSGDWGDLCEEDRQLNDEAVENGSRVLSAYVLTTGEKLWVITEADRSSTCLLLPSRILNSGYPPATCQNNILHHQEHTMHDSTESIRRHEVAAINLEPGSREALEAKHGQVWDTQELQQDYEVTGFMSPYIVVRRKSDGVVGSLKFQHRPRYYFDFKAD